MLVDLQREKSGYMYRGVDTSTHTEENGHFPLMTEITQRLNPYSRTMLWTHPLTQKRIGRFPLMTEITLTRNNATNLFSLFKIKSR